MVNVVDSARAFALGSLLAVSCVLPAGAESGTLSAFADVEANGSVYQTGETEATFAGVLSGPIYVQGADGSMETGLLTCPAIFSINTDDLRQTGEGACTAITPDGERIYADLTCSGSLAEGCIGEMVFTGGSGSRAGITGGGAVVFRNMLPILTSQAGNMIAEEAVGLLRIPSLTYQLP